MSDLFQYFAIISFLFVTVVVGYGGFTILIKNKFNPVGYLLIVLFLLCLKGISDLIPSVLIDSVTLLQIDSTIIAGAIILLTITSFVGKQEHEPLGVDTINNKTIAFTPHQVASGTIVAFGVSAFFILIIDIFPIGELLSVLCAIAGFVYLIIAGYVIGKKERFSQPPTKKGADS